MVGKVGLSAAAAAAVGGLQDAGARADVAADTVVRAGAAASDTVDLSDAARAGEPLDDVKGAVDLRMARYQFAAAVRVLRTLDEMSDDVLSLIGPKR